MAYKSEKEKEERNQSTSSVDALLEDSVNKSIDTQKYRVREALKEVEKNTRISFQAHIDFHKFLMEEAKAKGDIASAVHHQVLMETYQGILKNFSLSNSYDKA